MGHKVELLTDVLLFGRELLGLDLDFFLLHLIGLSVGGQPKTKHVINDPADKSRKKTKINK